MSTRDGTESDGSVGVKDASMNAYERQRAAIIARNKARLDELGLTSAYQAFVESVAPKKKPAQKRKRESKQKQEPSRKSSRLQGHGAEDASELGLFIINDECPRCNKVITKGHKRHLKQCTVVKRAIVRGNDLEGEKDQEEEENEAVQKPPKKRKSSTAKTQTEKLAELELSGLVDFTDERAEFAILGSTGSHYKVVFAKGGKGFGVGNSSCQCMDYRLRKHSCKHIRLVLKQMGMESDPNGWHQAIERHFHKLGAKAAADRQPGKDDATKDEENDSPTGKIKVLERAKVASKSPQKRASKKAPKVGTSKIGGRKVPTSMS